MGVTHHGFYPSSSWPSESRGRNGGSVATGDRCGLNPDIARKVRFIMYDIPRTFEIRMNPPFRLLFDRLSILTDADINDIKFQ